MYHVSFSGEAITQFLVSWMVLELFVQSFLLSSICCTVLLPPWHIITPILVGSSRMRRSLQWVLNLYWLPQSSYLHHLEYHSCMWTCLTTIVSIISVSCIKLNKMTASIVGQISSSYTRLVASAPAPSRFSVNQMYYSCINIPCIGTLISSLYGH